jgi:hypothetical protein
VGNWLVGETLSRDWLLTPKNLSYSDRLDAFSLRRSHEGFTRLLCHVSVYIIFTHT